MKRTLTIISVCVLCLTGFLVCQILSAAAIAPLYTGQAAKTWAGQSGERYAQIEVFFPYAYKLDDEKIRTVRNSIDTSLLAVSLDSSGRRLYADAWSAKGNVSVTGVRGSANAAAIGAGGDFFLFHPLYLRDGSYIQPTDLMRDRVVLDEELAWRIYGSVNLAGLEVSIGGKPFIIAGVVSRESGRAFDKTYTDGAGLFMSVEALIELAGDVKIDSYEIVMPDIVTDFALNAVKNAFNDETLHITDNTSRFDNLSIFNVVRTFGERSIRPDAVSYPYWENAVRYTEDILALYLSLSAIFLVYPAILAVIYGIRFIRLCVKNIKEILRRQIKKRDDRAYEKYVSNMTATP